MEAAAGQVVEHLEHRLVELAEAVLLVVAADELAVVAADSSKLIREQISRCGNCIVQTTCQWLATFPL